MRAVLISHDGSERCVEASPVGDEYHEPVERDGWLCRRRYRLEAVPERDGERVAVYREVGELEEIETLAEIERGVRDSTWCWIQRGLDSRD